MATSNRELSAPPGGARAGVAGLAALTAAFLLTPWAWGTAAPPAQFVFRLLGLTALFFVSLGAARGAYSCGAWQARVASCWTLFLLLSAASGALSIHRGRSLELLLNLLAFAGLFHVGAAVVRGERRLRVVAVAVLLAALPVAALGVLQFFRPEFLPAGSSYGNRVLGSFGQPNRLGGYLAGVIPVAVGLSLAASGRAARWALSAAIFCLTLCLLATYSRGAWIGLAAGLLALAAALASRRELQPRRWTLAASLACLALPVLFLLPSVLSRVGSGPAPAAGWSLPFDPERQGSGAMRLAIWSGSMRAASHRPVLGSGPGTFQQAYDLHKDATLKRLEAEGGRTADHAHNHYLELLVEGGFLGLIAFVATAALSLAAAAAALRRRSPARERVLVAGFAASAVALLANGALDYNLSLIPHAVLLFAILGILAAAPGATGAPARFPRAGLAGAAVALLAVGAALASYGAARWADAATREARRGRPDLAARNYAAASRLAPWNDGHAIAHAAQAARLAERGGGAAALREAEAAYRRAIRVNASDPVTRHELARLYLAHREVWGDAGVREAKVQLTAALAQNPYYAEIRNDLGVAQLWSGDRVAAVDTFRRATDGRRNFVDPLLNLASLALESGDAAEARAWVRQALERDPTSLRARDLQARLDSLATRAAAPRSR
jgi:O-antigen ligase